MAPSLSHVMPPRSPTIYRFSRSLPMPWPFPLRTSLRTCGPFPPRALPRLYGTTGHSATLSARPDPCGLPVGVCYTTVRASRVATPSILHACQCQYPGGNRPVHVSFSSRSTSGLPHDTGGSASALPFSRPARHSLRVPACMLAKSPKRSFCQSASVIAVGPGFPRGPRTDPDVPVKASGSSLRSRRRA